MSRLAVAIFTAVAIASCGPAAASRPAPAQAAVVEREVAVEIVELI